MAVKCELNNKPGIYCITIKGNNKRYIGSSKNLQVRKNAHINLLNNNNHFNQPLQNAFNKYGKSKYKFEIIEFAEKENIINREQYYIDYFGISNLYNIFAIAGDTSKMIKAKKGNRLSEEHKRNISLGNKGRVCSASTKKRLSESHKYKKLTQDHKNKLRESHTGKILTRKHRENISIGSIGKMTEKNTSGHPGVQIIKSTGKYRVRIKNKSYGCYQNKEDAIMKAQSIYKSLVGGVLSQL